MSFWDYLTAGKKYREADNERRSSDYSSGYSRPRRVEYKAYCKKCGQNISGTCSSPDEAIRKLQEGGSRIFSGDCGRGNHFPEIQEVEY